MYICRHDFGDTFGLCADRLETNPHHFYIFPVVPLSSHSSPHPSLLFPSPSKTSTSLSAAPSASGRLEKEDQLIEGRRRWKVRENMVGSSLSSSSSSMISCGGGGEMMPFTLMVLLQVGYAGMNIISKLAMDSGFNPFVLVTYRQIFATIATFPLAFFLERYISDGYNRFSRWKIQMLVFLAKIEPHACITKIDP